MRSYKTWWWTAVVFQWITASFYPFSLLIDAKPANETEKQLFNLMQNYPYNMGGMEVTMQNLFTALGACFSLLYFFGAILNYRLLQRGADETLLRVVLQTNLLIFGICFAVMATRTYPAPIILTGLVFLFLAVAILLIPKLRPA
jgi:hypothetical protein